MEKFYIKTDYGTNFCAIWSTLEDLLLKMAFGLILEATDKYGNPISIRQGFLFCYHAGTGGVRLFTPPIQRTPQR